MKLNELEFLVYPNFTKVRHCHNHFTRNSEYNFWVPPVKSQQKDTFYYNGIQNWNILPNNIKSIKNFNRFKISVKEYLTENFSAASSESFLYY